VARYCTDAFIGFPVNDFGVNSIATIKANILALIANLKSHNSDIRIWLCRSEPRTTVPASVTGIAISSLTSVGNTATAQVASTALLADGMYLTIAGATGSLAYNGVFPITVTGPTTFTYQFGGAGGAAATGSPTYSDVFGSLANQQYTAGCAPGGDREAYNAWLPTLVGTVIDGFIDPNTAVESGGSGASSKWVPNSSGDGTHPNDTGYTAEAAAYKNQLLAQGFIPNIVVF
jgi:hypothetical protein